MAEVSDETQPDKEAKDEKPPHARLFDWRVWDEPSPYRWKEGFPLKAILRPRRSLESGLSAGEGSIEEG